jgi:hypothetical protein
MSNANNTTLGPLQFDAGMGTQGLFWTDSTQDNITASATQTQAGATPIVAQLSRVTTVASSGNAVVLPPALPGIDLIVANADGNPMTVFASGSDTVNGFAGNVGVQQMAQCVAIYLCVSKGAWLSADLGTGYSTTGSGSFATFSSGTITAATTHTQAAATPITAMQVAVTVGNAGDGVLLPPAQIGLELLIANLSASLAGQLYASGSDTINGTAGATGISLTANALTIVACFQATKWLTK